MKLKFKPNKKQLFEISFSAIVAILFIVKLCGGCQSDKSKTPSTPNIDTTVVATPQQANLNFADTMALAASRCDSILSTPYHDPQLIMAVEKPHKIYSVSDFSRAFPDINPVQIAAARHHGVAPRNSRDEIASMVGDSLICISHNPYYTVAPLTSSSPYLIPRAKKLLARIGRNFIDSLLIKKIPPSLIIVSSVTRSLEDIKGLRTINTNATENSCHSYGTTIDISYINYAPIVLADGTTIRQARSDTLQWVLSEVLNDLRSLGACYVKYERKQGCYHITVR